MPTTPLPPARSPRAYALWLLGFACTPLLLWLPVPWLIPDWYEMAVSVLTALGVVQLIALFWLVVHAGRAAWRVARMWKRIAGSLAVLLAVAVYGAAWLTGALVADERTGSFLCSRELASRTTCERGELYRFLSLCIAGNLQTDAEYRPTFLPLMHRIDGDGTAECVPVEGGTQTYPTSYLP